MSGQPDEPSVGRRIWAIEIARSLIADAVGERLGPDALLLAFVILEQQERVVRRAVGFFREQLAQRCGFPVDNPRRLRAARQALAEDGWLWFQIPSGADRSETIYKLTPKSAFDIESIPLTRDENVSGEHVTPRQNCPDPRDKNVSVYKPHRDENVPPPGTNLSHPPGQKCPTTNPVIPNPVITNPNTPLPPKRGNLLENDLNIEACVPSEKQTLSKSVPTPAAETCPNQTPPLEAADEKFRLNGTPKSKANRDKSHSRFTPPSLEDVTAYCRERNNTVDPEQWLNHYQANGWMVGKSKMRDWQAAVRTWEKPKTQQPTKGPNNGKSNQSTYRSERNVPGTKPHVWKGSK